jgi:hypothetical protein
MKRGPYGDRQNLFDLVLELRRKGYGYRSISRQTDGLPVNTIRRWVEGVSVDKAISHNLAAEYFKAAFKPFGELRTDSARRAFLIRDQGHRCQKCQNTEWLAQRIPLELDHIDGDRFNNCRNNLQLLCPNCHAFTETYKGKNMKRVRSKRALGGVVK